MANAVGRVGKLTRPQVQEQAADSSGAPPDYKGRIAPYPAGRGEARGSAGDWRLRAVQHAGPSEPPATSHWPQHVSVRDTTPGVLQYGWKSLSPGGSP